MVNRRSGMEKIMILNKMDTDKLVLTKWYGLNGVGGLWAK